MKPSKSSEPYPGEVLNVGEGWIGQFPLGVSAGFYVDMPARVYHADPAPMPSLNQTIAKVVLNQSPIHAKFAHPRLSPIKHKDREPYKKALAIGDACHALVIGRGKNLAIGEWDSWRSNVAKEFYDAAIQEGKTPILTKHFLIAREMFGGVFGQISQHEASDCFANGAGEVVLIWEEDGIWLRTMIDWLHDDLCLVDDLKTGYTAAPHVIPYKMSEDGWDVQAAMYERGLDRLDPANRGRRHFRFVPLENEPPYALSVHTMSEGILHRGREKLEAAIRIWRRCMETNEWPGYSTNVCRPEMPAFRDAQWLERQAELEGEDDE